MPGSLRRRGDVAERAAGEFVGRVAQERLGGGAHIEEPALAVQRDDDVGHVLGQQTVAGLAPLQLRPGEGFGHLVEGSGELPKGLDPLGEVACRDHLHLPREVAEPGLQRLPAAGERPLFVDRVTEVALADAGQMGA